MDHSAFKPEVGIQEAAHQNTDKQGGIHLLGDKSQNNSYQGRNQTPDGGVSGRVPADGRNSLTDVNGKVRICRKIITVPFRIGKGRVRIGKIVF